MSSVWLIRIQRRIGHPGMVLVSKDNGAVLTHNKIAARDTQATEGLVSGAGKLLGTSIILG